MPLNISYYRTKGQVKAFPKFNNKIHSFGPTKILALTALRNNSDFIMWLQDQYVTNNITKECLANMLGITHQRIDRYITKKKLIPISTPKVEKFYCNTTQIIIIRRLQRGGFLRKDENNNFCLCDALGETINVARERYPDIKELVANDFIIKGNTITKQVFDGIAYRKMKFTTYVIAKKGITLLS